MRRQRCRAPSTRTPTSATLALPVPATLVPDLPHQTTHKPDISLGLQSVAETTTPLPLNVTGTFPDYLANHTYYRNGPGVFEVEHADGKTWEAEHWFDALGMVHSFAIDQNAEQVSYRSKSTGDSIIDKMQSNSKEDYAHVSVCREQKANESIFDSFKQIYGMSTAHNDGASMPDNVSVTLEAIPGQGALNARSDANVAHRLNPETLETEQKYTFEQLDEKLAGEGSCAHGMVDKETGEYFNFVSGYSFFGKVDYKVFRVGKDGKTNMMTSFKENPYLIHSFSLTENYVVINLWPAQLNLMKLLWTRSVADSCSMRPNTPTKFMVISRHTNEVVATYEHEQFFCFHTMNAFEKDNAIHIDLGHYDSPNKIMRDLRLDNIKSYGSFEKCVPMRFTLPNISQAIEDGPTVRHAAHSKLIADVQMEVGVVAADYKHREYKYVYGVSDKGSGALFGDVTKLNVETGEIKRWSVEGTLTGEPTFVPDPDSVDEDGGSLLTVVLDTKSRTSSLVVLDARTMTEVARAEHGSAIPLGFHGCYRESE